MTPGNTIVFLPFLTLETAKKTTYIDHNGVFFFFWVVWPEIVLLTFFVIGCRMFKFYLHFKIFITNFLPSEQFVMISRIPGQLGIPIQACCGISTIHLPQWSYVEGTFSLNIQCSTGSGGARKSCASVPVTFEAS